MPDICMCKNPNCGLALHCHRFVAVPYLYQTYIILDQPVKTEEDCKYYWEEIDNETSIVELQKAD